jgi:hypothetical protein
VAVKVRIDTVKLLDVLGIEKAVTTGGVVSVTAVIATVSERLVETFPAASLVQA